MSPYRTPAAPERLALTRWQETLVALLGDRCAHWRWYRAFVGGAWTFYGGANDPGESSESFRWVRREADTCAICNLYERLCVIPRWLLLPKELHYLRENADHRCEVYPERHGR